MTVVTLARMQLVEVDSEPASLAFLVTGVPGSGKTTVARELAARFERGAHIPTDVLGAMILAGRVPPLPPSEEVEEGTEEGGEADRQLLLRARNASLLCDSFFDAGFTPVIDDVVVHRIQLDYYQTHVRARPLFIAVLAPRPEIVLARDSSREQHKRGLAEEWWFLEQTLRTELPDAGIWVDSSDLSPAETVDAILAAANGAGAEPSDAR